MIEIKNMNEEQVHQLKEIDRSETIEAIYEMQGGNMVEIATNHECPNWDEALVEEMKERYLYELRRGGLAVGAFDGSVLVGFGVLAHQFRGRHRDQLQVDLMYVSRTYRRQGIGRLILKELSDEARRRGAKSLYISSTETRSAVSFYKSEGSTIAQEVDEELYKKEPKDIHMVIEL